MINRNMNCLMELFAPTTYWCSATVQLIEINIFRIVIAILPHHITSWRIYQSAMPLWITNTFKQPASVNVKVKNGVNVRYWNTICLQYVLHPEVKVNSAIYLCNKNYHTKIDGCCEKFLAVIRKKWNGVHYFWPNTTTKIG